MSVHTDYLIEERERYRKVFLRILIVYQVEIELDAGKCRERITVKATKKLEMIKQPIKS